MNSVKMPEWFINKYENNVNNLSDYHKKCWDNLEDGIKEYANKAIECGAVIAYSAPNANGIDIAIACHDRYGEVVVFSQGLYGDPTYNTFVHIQNHNVAINRCAQCKGIPIWDTKKLLDKSLACSKCGEQVNSFDELNYVLYAGLECDKCAKGSWDYINSKPAGYWTD